MLRYSRLSFAALNGGPGPNWIDRVHDELRCSMREVTNSGGSSVFVNATDHDSCPIVLEWRRKQLYILGQVEPAKPQSLAEL